MQVNARPPARPSARRPAAPSHHVKRATMTVARAAASQVDSDLPDWILKAGSSDQQQPAAAAPRSRRPPQRAAAPAAQRVVDQEGNDISEFLVANESGAAGGKRAPAELDVDGSSDDEAEPAGVGPQRAWAACTAVHGRSLLNNGASIWLKLHAT